MLIGQIAVFLENRQGRLNDLLLTLSDANVNVQSLNIADTSDFGIVRMLTDNNSKAMDVLKKAGFTATTTNLVAVEVDDRPGSLSRTLIALTNAGINIEYVYSFTVREGTTLILFKADDLDYAQKVLAENNM